ncbi:MAG: cell division protein FtsQ/DivIB, partial [Endozoicomonas sp.]
VSVLLLSGLFYSAPGLVNWVNQPIARVEVHSPFQNLSRQGVEERLQPLLEVRFFELELEGMRTALQAMPWVKAASVRRYWPDRLQVNIEEQQAVARWGDRQLISNDGEVFTPVDVSKFSAMPVLSGSEDKASEVMQQYLAISQLLRPMGLAVVTLERGENGAWRFKVGHVVVNIGRDRRMERLQRFIRLYHARLESQWQRVSQVDLRYLNGAAVAWRGSVQKH